MGGRARRRGRSGGVALALAALAACSPGVEAPAPRQQARSAAVRLRDTDMFVPPGPSERRAAVGPIDHLPATLQRAFTGTHDFRAMLPPEPGDWLHRVRERGQTFAEFVRAPTPYPDPPGRGRDTIYILPLGDFPDGFVVEEERVVLVRSPDPALLEDYAERYFSLEVELLPAIPADELEVTRRVRDGRDQLRAPELVERLAERLPADGFCLLALTNDDLYIEDDQEYAFGYAALTGRVGVYSFARYDPLFNGEARGPDYLDLILARSLKIMAHEIGHMFGLEHCVHYSCVMNGAADLIETDRHPLHLCPVCLRKLQLATGLDPVARYRALREFHEELGFPEELAWIDRRLAYVTGEY
ncbi:MAG: hypothetical protein KC636_16150 [Myxococcales bacterium]|nr:hypothetical protein [Myxococcales bacterium]